MDERNDGAREELPIIIQLEWNDRLNVELVLEPLVIGAAADEDDSGSLAGLDWLPQRRDDARVQGPRSGDLQHGLQERNVIYSCYNLGNRGV